MEPAHTYSTPRHLSSLLYGECALLGGGVSGVTKSHRRRLPAWIPVLAGMLGFLTCCASPPQGRSLVAPAASRSTPAAPALSKPATAASGIQPLGSGTDAFVARIALARQAQRTLDLQYYIRHADTTGRLLTGAVVEAAERGVKVRLLLDDLGTAAAGFRKNLMWRTAALLPIEGQLQPVPRRHTNGFAAAARGDKL